jgi:RNA polymerase sigma factor (sigma-70 family)
MNRGREFLRSKWRADAGEEKTGVTAHDPQESLVSRQQLFECIQENAAPLLGTIRSYVLSFRLATGPEVQLIATEVLQETVIEALSHADVYVATGQPMAWLLGIAINVIRRKRTAQAKQIQRELPLSQLAAQHPEISDESELLEHLLSPGEYGPEQEVETREQVAALLALVSHEDQYIIRLALLEDFKRAGLAERLGVLPNTARMRLRRALDRLRTALEEQQSGTEGGEHHA